MKTETEKLSAADWIARLGDAQQLAPAEKAALTDFLRDSPTNIRELIEQAFVREDLQRLPVTQQQLDHWISEARASTTCAIPFPGQCTSATSVQQDSDSVVGKFNLATLSKIVLGRKFLLATSLTAALIIGGVFMHSRMGLYSTGFGEQRTLTLADGSVVSLNTESQMKVAFSARIRSIALLKGEAFFNVAHDTSRPFLVSVDNAVVRAVGTQFNVKLAAQNTVVSMVEGVVKVSLNKHVASNDAAPAESSASLATARTGGATDTLPATQIMLGKGEAASIGRRKYAADGDMPLLSKIDAKATLRAASWTQGRLEFEAMPLTGVLLELQRYRRFDVHIDDETTGQLKLTGSFGSHDFESVLAYIATIPGMTVEKNGPNSYFIRRS